MAGLIPPLIPKERREAFERELARLEKQRHDRQTLPPEPAPDDHLDSAYTQANSDCEVA